MSNNYKYRRPKKPKTEDNYNPPFPAEALAESVKTLGLREETLALLEGANVVTLLDVTKREEKDFYKILTFNKKNLIDVKMGLKKKAMFLKPTVQEVKADVVTNNVKTNNGAQTPVKGNNATVKTVGNTKGNGLPNGNFNKNNLTNANSVGNDRKNIPNAKGKGNDNKNGIKQRQDSAPQEYMSPKYDVIPARPPRVVTPIVKETPDIYLKMNRAGKWGFKDRMGKQAVAPIYDEVYNYHEDLCCVEKDEKCGFINREGEEVIPIVYDCATSFSEGYACVFKREKCGYIDKSNEIIIPFKYDAGTPIENGECRVKLDGKWGELHLDDINTIRWIT